MQPAEVSLPGEWATLPPQGSAPASELWAAARRDVSLTISVVIPVHNEGADILPCLDRILREHRPHSA